VRKEGEPSKRVRQSVIKDRGCKRAKKIIKCKSSANKNKQEGKILKRNWREGLEQVGGKGRDRDRHGYTYVYQCISAAKREKIRVG